MLDYYGFKRKWKIALQNPNDCLRKIEVNEIYSGIQPLCRRLLSQGIQGLE